MKQFFYHVVYDFHTKGFNKFSRLTAKNLDIMYNTWTYINWEILMRLLRNWLILIVSIAITQFQMHAYAQKHDYIVQANAKSANKISVPEWFNRYDKIRYQAQMSPSERQKADVLLAGGASMLVPGDKKAASCDLLSKLVLRYKTAIISLNALPRNPETLQLHKGYYQYFLNAYQLFSDYLKVQDNLLAVDSNTGQPIATGLIQRKSNLESLERSVKDLDRNMRLQFGISSYPY
jgi:hypothetical protein